MRIIRLHSLYYYTHNRQNKLALLYSEYRHKTPTAESPRQRRRKSLGTDAEGVFAALRGRRRLERISKLERIPTYPLIAADHASLYVPWTPRPQSASSLPHRAYTTSRSNTNRRTDKMRLTIRDTKEQVGNYVSSAKRLTRVGLMR